ncbi:MAG: zf-TFIIB domain-containing protein [Deltaproteobacteria bacterium]|nr:zf-TFIIB domain-containing protein [Deltaproteobacteria bacterium]
MQCPKCRAALEIVIFDDVKIDRCTGCYGLWFDRGEDTRLRKSPGAAAIDIGDPKLAKPFNEMTRVDCPRCRTRMVRMVYAPQPHIWYESCATCGGVWFDAGEFRDSLHVSLWNVIQDWFTPTRK